MNKYMEICLQYGITEEAMEEYIQNELVLHEDASMDDTRYNAYVERCNRQGIKPKNKQDYFNSRAKTIKGLKIGAAAVGTLAAGRYVARHTSVGRQVRKGFLDNTEHYNRKIKADRKSIKREDKKRKSKFWRG